MKNHFARRPLPTFEGSQLCPQPSPPYSDGGGTLTGSVVRLLEANKRARSAIGLTRDRLAAEAQPGNGRVMAGGEAPAAPPWRRGCRRMRGKS
jgi:hypothetical protein